jgi:hypothetical protein
MGEQQVSVEGARRPLPELFFVIATQNPVEFRGAYPLPEAQIDRFALQFALGYVALEQEVSILDEHEQNHPLDRIAPCASLADALCRQQSAPAVRLSAELKRYIVDLVRATRTAAGVQLGASPRASLALMKAARAAALFDGSAFVSPDHVQELAVPVIAHRMVLEPSAPFWPRSWNCPGCSRHAGTSQTTSSTRFGTSAPCFLLARPFMLLREIKAPPPSPALCGAARSWPTDQSWRSRAWTRSSTWSKNNSCRRASNVMPVRAWLRGSRGSNLQRAARRQRPERSLNCITSIASIPQASLTRNAQG